jgi:hypothetical protein
MDGIGGASKARLRIVNVVTAREDAYDKHRIQVPHPAPGRRK